MGMSIPTFSLLGALLCLMTRYSAFIANSLALDRQCSSLQPPQPLESKGRRKEPADGQPFDMDPYCICHNCKVCS